MTTLYDAQSNLLDEVEARLRDLVPEQESQHRFHVRSEAAKALKATGKTTGSPRLFEFGIPDFISHDYVGKSTRGLRYHVPIVINYPAIPQRKWYNMATSDAERIRYDLINNQTSVSGVQTRFLKHDAPMQVERSENDEQMTLTLIMLAIYDVTGS